MKIVDVDGYSVKIDDEDEYLIKKYSWRARVDGKFPNKRVYFSYITPRPEHKIMYLHREIMHCTPDMQVDHVAYDYMDLQKSSMRICSNAENGRNRRINKDSVSGYRGVTWSKRLEKWKATVVLDGKQIHLGYYNTASEAHAVYCAKAKKLFGDFFRVA
jgi:hypothetical protein